MRPHGDSGLLAPRGQGRGVWAASLAGVWLAARLGARTNAATLDVTAYGAVPDNGSDDTAAIQSAINQAAPGDTIYFPTGVFHLGSPLQGANNLSYLGTNGSILATLPPATNSIYMFRFVGGATNVLIQNLQFSGGQAFSGHVVSTNGYPFDHAYFTNITLRDCTFSNNPTTDWYRSPYIQMDARADGVTIACNRFYNYQTLASNQNGAIALRTCSNTLITSNYFQQLNGGAATFDTNGDNVEFSYNTVNGYNYGAWTHFGTGLLTHGRVLNNRCTGQNTNFQSEAICLSLVCPSSGLLVAGNYLAGEQNSEMNEFRQAANGIFAQNVVQGFQMGVQTDGTNLRFVDNTFLNPQDRCVHVAASTTGLRLSANLVINPGTRILGNQSPVTGVVFDNNLVLRRGGFWPNDTNQTFRAIYSDSITNVLATNNVLVQTSPSPPAGFKFIGLIPTGADGNYSGNAVVSLSTAPFGFGMDTPLAGTLANNTFQGLAKVCNVTNGAVAASGNLAINCAAGAWPPGFIAATTTAAVPQASLALSQAGETVNAAAAASDADGGIATFTYYFGDGPPIMTASSTLAHVYTNTATPPTVGVVVTDHTGAMVAVTGLWRPVIAQPGYSGTNLLLQCTGGTAGGSYVILCQTNIAAPLANWWPVATNAFDATGAGADTLPLIPAVPQACFLIQQPLSSDL